MIVANLASYPPREASLHRVLRAMAPQVDRLNLVLNEYAEAPAFVRDFANVRVILPRKDLKDTGKFYPTLDPGDTVFLIDDDLRYPDNYVEQTLRLWLWMQALPVVAGYHASTYLPFERTRFRDRGFSRARYRRRLSRFREVAAFFEAEKAPTLADQLGTGTVVTTGSRMPPFEYMRDSAGFVDVRFARWCFEQGLRPVSLPRPFRWLSQQKVEGSLFEDVTHKHHPHIEQEIASFATRQSDAGARFDPGPPPPPQRPAAASKPSKLFWSWYEPRNFGDWIGPWLFRKMTGREPEFLPQDRQGDERCIYSAGSILRKIRFPDTVTLWGSGIISEQDVFSRPERVLAVRGPRTAARLRCLGYQSSSVFGDPALLAPLYYQPSLPRQAGRVGLIAHFIDHADWAENRQGPWTLIDVTRSVEQVIDEISQCEFAFSASLHGLIVAHAYGVPCLWIGSSRPLDGDGAKFRDYLSSVDGGPMQAMDFFGQPFDKALRAVRASTLPELSTLQNDLLNVCPF